VAAHENLPSFVLNVEVLRCPVVHAASFLQPENILLSDKSPDAAIKVIDFGTSDFCLPNQRLQQKFGTPYYVRIALSGFALPAMCCVSCDSRALCMHFDLGHVVIQ
jgi:serine/threonine protein kinase